MSLAAALGWKFNHEPGIETKAGKITAWPDSLGTKPNESQQQNIILEHEEFLKREPLKRDKLDALITLLEKSGVVTPEEAEATRNS